MPSTIVLIGKEDIDPEVHKEISKLVITIDSSLVGAPSDQAVFALCSVLASGLLDIYQEEAEQMLDTVVVEAIRATIKVLQKRDQDTA